MMNLLPMCIGLAGSVQIIQFEDGHKYFLKPESAWVQCAKPYPVPSNEAITDNSDDSDKIIEEGIAALERLYRKPTKVELLTSIYSWFEDPAGPPKRRYYLSDNESKLLALALFPEDDLSNYITGNVALYGFETLKVCMPVGGSDTFVVRALDNLPCQAY